VVVDIKQHKSQFNNSNFTIIQSAKFFRHSAIPYHRTKNYDFTLYIAGVMMV